ncbi:hypothetical protein SAMD00023353_2201520 [Rosellinia necatrix]|uniref:Transmembrane protein n=1 Tax=Rosellinia necatrix TaxID=77044 RepID=A0A1S8A7R9_ROSNE|nr:hypothetical protein SAMD00023353_2201520 [Rosellinia necatrix]
MEEEQQLLKNIWFYDPNKGAAIFFAIAFAATGAVHCWQAVYAPLSTRRLMWEAD